MPRDIVETHLTDIDGREIRYETIPYQWRYAEKLKMKLAAILGGPIGEALEGLASDEGVDMATLGATLAKVPQALMDAGGPELFAEILKDTTRFEPRDNGKIERQSLSDPIMLDRAYSGNQYEAYQALLWVLKVNYLPFLQAIYRDLQPKLTALGLQSNGSENE